MLRYSEGGKAFLRWMTSRAMDSEEWTDFVEVVPVHWLKDISSIADSLSTEWAMFAAQPRGWQQSSSRAAARRQAGRAHGPGELDWASRGVTVI
jgi:hypothetical protein